MRIRCLVWCLLGTVSALGQGVTNFEVRANADNVNLRVRPDAGTEVVAQARENQRLSVVRVEGEWLGVRAPTNSGVWIKTQFVKNGVVTGGKIRLRCGPGISYRDVGVIREGVAVVTRENHGDWVKIVPPADLVLWISRSMVASIEPVLVMHESEPVAPMTNSPGLSQPGTDTESTNRLFAGELPPGLAREHLAPVLGQGALVKRVGKVERVPLAFFRGVNYRLVDEKDGQPVTVCYLEGNDQQMPSLVGQRLCVKGREYWMKNQSCAVVYPELITPVGK